MTARYKYRDKGHTNEELIVDYDTIRIATANDRRNRFSPVSFFS
jgi:hypothetical protein